MRSSTTFRAFCATFLFIMLAAMTIAGVNGVVVGPMWAHLGPAVGALMITCIFGWFSAPRIFPVYASGPPAKTGLWMAAFLALAVLSLLLTLRMTSTTDVLMEDMLFFCSRAENKPLNACVRVGEAVMGAMSGSGS